MIPEESRFESDPEELVSDPPLPDGWEIGTPDASDRFEVARDRRKAVRQAARAVLPNATETKIFTTANVRSWRHFIEMRGAIYADWEIRYLALEVLDLLQKEAPLLFGDFEISALPDGTRIAVPEYSKV